MSNENPFKNLKPNGKSCNKKRSKKSLVCIVNRRRERKTGRENCKWIFLQYIYSSARISLLADQSQFALMCRKVDEAQNLLTQPVCSVWKLSLVHFLKANWKMESLAKTVPKTLPRVSSHSGQSTRCLIASLTHTMAEENSSWPGNQNKKLIWWQQ